MNPLLFPLFAEQKGGGIKKKHPRVAAGVFLRSVASRLCGNEELGGLRCDAAAVVDPDAVADHYVVAVF